MGLGSASAIRLAEARTMALRCRRQRIEGLDPIEERNSLAAEKRRIPTFDDCAKQCLESLQLGFKNTKHISQWKNTLTTYASPVLGHLAIDAIKPEHVIKVLQPIWKTKTETANRLRARIERIINWAQAHGYYSGANPARWRGHLDQLLSKPRQTTPTTHFAALPFEDLPLFISKIRSKPNVSYLALEFAILTASRTNEVINATWDEIDFSTMTWNIPAYRMKAKKAHRVPLCPRAAEILQSLPAKGEGYIFNGLKPGLPLSNMALLSILRRMDLEITVHGFRSTFRDWVAERTNTPNEVAEAALAHVIKSQTEAAYRRGDLFQKRRSLMEIWGDYCSSNFSNTPNVIDFRAAIGK